MQALRHIRIKPGASVTQSIKFEVVKADISTVSFKPENTYAKQPEKLQAVIRDVVKYATFCGVDAAGAVEISIPGGAHSGGPGIDTFERVTGTVLGPSGRMYFYRKSDGTFWERLHIPTFIPSNEALWNRENDYVHITEAEYNAKKLVNTQP